MFSNNSNYVKTKNQKSNFFYARKPIEFFITSYKQIGNIAIILGGTAIEI